MMKIQFLYVPSKTRRRNSGVVTGPMVMPVGVLALADLLAKAKHDVEATHAGIEWALNAKFDLAEDVRRKGTRLVAMPLHFHQQLSEVRKAVRNIRAASPETLIALGGFTASFYFEQIMSRWRGVDFVVRGDGEAPLFQLARELDKKKGRPLLETIPNLSYRDGDRIIHNEFCYAADETVLDKLKFTNLSLLRNGHIYGGDFLLKQKDGMGAYLANRFFYLCGGRGCSVNCAYCAGSSLSQKQISARRMPIYRSARSMAEDVRDLNKRGVDNFYLCFDPPGNRESPFREFMERLRRDGARASLVFESYSGLPEEAFVQEFSETFDSRGSALTFSPATASEERRKFFNGYFYYSNAALEKKLDQCARLDVKTKLYFSLFPNETTQELKKSCNWALSLLERFGSDVVFMPIEIEPGAPWHLRPEKYGVKPTCSTFEDFIERSRKFGFGGIFDDPGYRFPYYKKKMDYLMSRELVH